MASLCLLPIIIMHIYRHLLKNPRHPTLEFGNILLSQLDILKLNTVLFLEMKLD